MTSTNENKGGAKMRRTIGGEAKEHYPAGVKATRSDDQARSKAVQ